MQAIRGLVGEVAEADPAVAVGVISSCKAEQKIPYRTACRALGVSESWFYKWRDRPPTAREVRRQQLAEEIEEIFLGSGGTYGSPKVFIELVRRGWRVSVNTVAKVMAELGLAGRKVRRRRSLTRPGKRPAAADFVHRDFTAEEPDLVWAGDLTEIETGEGKLYLATVIDLFSRRLLGYAMAARHDADLVVASLNMAAATRGGDVRGVIMHTDRGSRVLLATVQAGLPKARHCPVHGQSRILFRQRRERGVQQRPQSRVRPPPHLPHPLRGPHQDRHLDHRLLQRQASTQRVRVQEPDRPRT